MSRARVSAALLWFDQRNLRERGILLLCALILPLLLVNTFVLTPLGEEREAARRQVETLNVELGTLAVREAEILARKSYDPDKENREKKDQLEAEIERNRELLQTRITTLVTPREMPELLRDLLTGEQRLQLLRLANEQPERLQQVGSEADAELDEAPALYRHRLQLEFSGGYLATLDYLRQLEAMPQAISWDSVEIETDEYPKAKVRLRVHTLSLSEAWIGG
jgi:MSHA biogenesis protein MshJ